MEEENRYPLTVGSDIFLAVMLTKKSLVDIERQGFYHAILFFIRRKRHHHESLMPSRAVVNDFTVYHPSHPLVSAMPFQSGFSCLGYSHHALPVVSIILHSTDGMGVREWG
jgi:hypothetical protein